MTRSDLSGRPENWARIEFPDGTTRAAIYREDGTRQAVLNALDVPAKDVPLRPGTYTLKAETPDGLAVSRFCVCPIGTVSPAPPTAEERILSRLDEAERRISALEGRRR